MAQTLCDRQGRLQRKRSEERRAKMLKRETLHPSYTMLTGSKGQDRLLSALQQSTHTHQRDTKRDTHRVIEDKHLIQLILRKTRRNQFRFAHVAAFRIGGVLTAHLAISSMRLSIPASLIALRPAGSLHSMRRAWRMGATAVSDAVRSNTDGAKQRPRPR